MTRIERLKPLERLDLAKKSASRLVDHVIQLVRLHESNRIVVYTPTLSAQIPHSLAANTYNDFKESLFYFEVLRLCALWDKPSAERESIPSVLELLDSGEVLTLVDAAIEADWIGSHPRDNFGRQQVVQIQARLRRAQRVSRLIQDSAKLREFRDFRDKFLAHSLTTELSRVPKYGYEGRLLSVSIELVNRIYLATHNSSFMFQNSVEHAKRCANELWGNCKFDFSAS